MRRSKKRGTATKKVSASKSKKPPPRRDVRIEPSYEPAVLVYGGENPKEREEFYRKWREKAQARSRRLTHP